MRVVQDVGRVYWIALSIKRPVSMCRLPSTTLPLAHSGFTATKLPLFPTVKCIVSSRIKKSLQWSPNIYINSTMEQATQHAAGSKSCIAQELDHKHGTHLKAGIWLGNAISATPSSPCVRARSTQLACYNIMGVQHREHHREGSACMQAP